MTRFSLMHVPDVKRKPEKEAEAEADPVEEDGEEEATEEQLESRRRQMAEMQAEVQRLRRQADDADREKVNRFARLKREAVAAGDTETYDRLSREEGEFYQNIATRGQQQQPQQGDAAITQRWIAKNRWMANAYLSGQAQAIAQRYADQGVLGAEQLRRVEKEMRSDPEFARMIREYETGKSPNRAARTGKRDWNSIPAAERKLLSDTYFRKGAAQGLQDTPATRARMAKAWWDSNHPEE